MRKKESKSKGYIPGVTNKSFQEKPKRRYPEGTFKTLTVDNGSEFQDCKGMERDKSGNKRLTWLTIFEIFPAPARRGLP